MKTVSLCLLAGCLTLSAQTTIWTGTLTEPTNNNWSTQPIAMSVTSGVVSGGYTGGVPNPLTTRMMRQINGGALTEIPYQWISSCANSSGAAGCFLVEDGISAGETQTYILQSGIAPAAAVTNPVVAAKTTCPTGDAGWKISNGLTGICILATQPGSTQKIPIQGLLESGGATWTAYPVSGSNVFYAESSAYDSLGMVLAGGRVLQQRTPIGTTGLTPAATSYSAIFSESGPLKTVIQASYTFNRPNYYVGGGGYVTACGNALVNGVSVPNTITFEPGTGSQPPYSPMQVRLYLYSGSACTFNGVALTNSLSPYYTATIVPGSTSTYTLTLNGSAVTIGGTAGEILAYYMVNTATGCSNSCFNSSPGHYTATYTMYANSKSILVDEDTDMQVNYYLPLTRAFGGSAPNTARYRGHSAVSNDPRCGYDSAYQVLSAASSSSSPVVLSLSGGGGSGLYANDLPAYITGVGTIPNGVYYLQTTSPYSVTAPGLFTDAALTTPYENGAVNYSSGGLVKATYTGMEGPAHDPVYDAFFDITYGQDAAVGASCVVTSGSVSTNAELVTHLAANNPSSGWSFETYLSSQGSSGPLIGWYTGDYSALWYALGSEPGLYSSNSDFMTANPGAYLEVQTSLATASYGVVGCEGSAVAPGGTNLTQTCYAPDGTTNLTGGNNYSVHRDWGIFVSTQADLNSPVTTLATGPQPISSEQNNLTGVNLSRLYSYGNLVFSDPSGGYEYPYLSSSSAHNLIGLVQNGTSVCGSTACYFNELYYNSTQDTLSRSLLTLWRTDTSANLQSLIDNFVSTGEDGAMQALGAALANGDNHWDGVWGYYQIGNEWGFPALSSWPFIALDTNYSSLSSTLRNQAKTAPALFASLIWDDAWFPFDTIDGDGYGLGNQISAYLQYRGISANLLRYWSPMAPKLTSSLASIITNFQNNFSPQGANPGGVNYASAYMLSPYADMQGNAIAGGASIGSYPGWTSYPQWELAMQTPPEPRFSPSTSVQIRKEVEMGAGAPAAYQYRAGLIGTGLYPSYPTLAGNMIWAWQQSNNPSYNTYGIVTHDPTIPSLLAIDPTIPSVTPNITSIQIPGDWSHMRYNFGTPHETAIWFINGGGNSVGAYSPGGHRDYDDGQVTIYAHDAPLAIDYTTYLEDPVVYGELIHNRVVFDSEFSPISWSADNTSTSSPAELYGSPTNTQFSAFSNSTKSCATFLLPSDGTEWQRCVLHVNADPTYPLIYVSDTFPAGPSSSAAKTLSWHMMADHTQAVSIPVSPGSVTPVTRTSACGAVPSQYPSTGTVYSLPAGWQRFNFTGYTWPSHATGGINWDVFLNIPAGDGQFYIGEWGHGPNCITPREESEYNSANSTTGYYERQDILRAHSAGSFATLIAPYRKTEAPTRTLSAQSCGAQIVQGSETTCFNDSALTYTNGTVQILTVYDSSNQSAFGMTASGGAQELVNNGAGTITWTISDVTPGTRSITLPAGTWYPSIPVEQSGVTYTYYHGGGSQPTPVVITFTQTPQTLRAVALDYTAPAGATQVRVKFGSASNYAAIAACNPVCAIAIQAPLGTWPEQHDFLNVNGVVVASSEPQNIVVQ